MEGLEADDSEVGFQKHDRLSETEQRLQDWCIAATEVFLKKIEANKSYYTFEILTPCTLPYETGGHADFIGMEKLQFVRFLCTKSKNDLVVVLKHPELPTKNVLVYYKDFGKIFHKKAAKWVADLTVDGQHFYTQCEKLRQSTKETDQAKRYEESESYGSW